MFKDVKTMCQPAQAVVVLSVLSVLMEILQTRGLLNVHNIFVLVCLLVSQLTCAVLLDVFCLAGHKDFAWVIIILSGLIFIRADMYLQKGLNSLAGKNQTPVKRSGNLKDPKPSNY
jgi:hypothetical protein